MGAGLGQRAPAAAVPCPPASLAVRRPARLPAREAAPPAAPVPASVAGTGGPRRVAGRNRQGTPRACAHPAAPRRVPACPRRSASQLNKSAWNFAAIPIVYLFMYAFRFVCTLAFNPLFRLLGYREWWLG